MAEAKRDRPKKEITHFVVLGDSLSDGDNMGEKFAFLGHLINRLWQKTLGLDKSPKDRFTNGYTWADVLRATLISKFLNDDKIKKDSTNRFGKYNLDNADISDDIIAQSPHQRKRYTLEEVEAESNQVKRKKRLQDREIGHLFTIEEENTPNVSEKPRHMVDSTDIADATIAQRYKNNAKRAFLMKKEELPKTKLRESSDDISDEVITDPRYRKDIEEYYSLDNGRTAQYNGQTFFANYAQGGATSHDYSWSGLFLSILSPFTSIKLFFTRLMVSNLSKQVDQFLEDVEKQEISDEKEKTLVTVFSGANDLITVNAEPTREAADLAIKSNLENIKRLMDKGYKNIVLCNLPDLSLTPRFKGTAKEKQAHEIAKYYNEQLQAKLQDLIRDELAKRHSDFSIDLFDINTVFSGIYTDVEKNGKQSKYAQFFDATKLKEAYKDSPDYKINPDGTSPGSKHMFWDDVHPTATMHALLMSEFYKSKEALGQYALSAPKEQSKKHLCDVFQQKYHEKLDNTWFKFLSWNKELPINYNEPEKALITILRYALDKHNKQADLVREAMTDLGWWVNDEPNMCIPALADAMWSFNPKLARKLEAQLDPHLEQPKPTSPKMMAGALGVVAPHKKIVPPELSLPPEVEKKLGIMKKTQVPHRDDIAQKEVNSTLGGQDHVTHVIRDSLTFS
ncbi:SGNH/GDSL hydrolase family protein [Legionella parisiensis]|uniref:Thermolabile hemolysin n=1 Tax=Legionella parisiensis TaxID=45071 RepID=A0A1E5JL59_9GAMM|nr:SGNH/GDSL hydrolase family protein [Legionella parisiensis]KTD41664.1 lipolytic enzyme, GDSL family [Legionella parisiensis]OEH45259.1 Thermolabile hemolysin [Legionella parisiensis]STX76017.1 lipolytic enzyme, GDSL family [Legionella parisiensis]